MEVYSRYKVKEALWEPRTFMCVRSVVRNEKLGDFIEDNCSRILRKLNDLSLCSNGIPFAMIYSVDQEAEETDVAAAILCEDAVSVDSGYDVLMVGGKVLSTSHRGFFEDIKPAYEAMDQFLKKHNLQRNFFIEEYLGNPQTETDLNNWKTNIYCILDS